MSPQELLDHTLADLHTAYSGDGDRCRNKQERQYTDLASMLTLLIMSRGCTICTKHKASPPAQAILPQDIPNGLWQEIARLTTSTTKAKSTSSSAICLASTPSYLRVNIQASPFPFPKSIRNSYPSMNHPATSTLTMALPLHLRSSCSSYNNNRSLIPPLPHTSPDPMDSLRGTSKH